MGIVYRAYDPVLGREVAIKTLKLTELSDPAERDELRERLAREARAAAALSHAGIVGIFDVVQQGDVLGLVMERIEGSTLASLLTSGKPVDLDTALRIIRETAAALDYAHRKGIVHRDVKPANMMLDESGTVKVADFGIAKITTSQTRTQSDRGMIVGTAGYMAPEQLRGEVIDGHADQFSLAVVAYEMIARRRPFVADSLISLTHQVVFAQPPTLSSLRPGLGPGVDAVFLTALAKAPVERFPNCSAFAAALEAQVRAAIGQPTVAYPVTYSPSPAPVTYFPTNPQTPVPTPSQAIPPITYTQPPVTYSQAAPKRKSHWFTWVMAVILLVGGLAAMGFGVFSYFERKAAEDAQVEPDPVPAVKSESSKAKPESIAVTPGVKKAPETKTTAAATATENGISGQSWNGSHQL